MALRDEEVQELQSEVLDIINEKNEGQTYTTDKSGIEYKVIKEINKTTQAIAVAPLDKEGNPDYTQTTIVVAGTQSPNNENNKHVIESGFNAVLARNQLTEQTKAISKSKWKVKKWYLCYNRGI